MRAHLTLTADGRSVVTAGRQSRDALKNLETQTDRAGRAAGRANVQTKGYGTAMQGARRHALRLTAAVGGLAAGFSAKSILDASLTMDGIESAMRGAAGGTARARAETQFLREESDRLGIVFNSNISTYAKMLAAGNAMGMSGRDLRNVFSSMAETGVIFDFTAETMNGSLRALEQMMSKGVVTSEELKLQLGDRLPAVMPIAAKAMDVTTQEFIKMLGTGEILANEFLPKFANALREEFGDGLQIKLKSARAEFNRMKNDLFELQVEAARGGFLEGMIESSNSLRQALGDPDFRQDVTALFSAIGSGAGHTADFLVVLAKNTDLVAAGLAGIVGVKLVKWLSGVRQTTLENINIMRAKIATDVQAARTEVALALAAQKTASAHLFATQMAQARTAGTFPLIVANARAAKAETAYAAAVARTSAAQAAAVAASGRLATALHVLRGGMALLGGPLGLALVGITGLAFAYNRWNDAQKPVLQDSERELELIKQLQDGREALVDLSRDNASASLLEAEARLANAEAMEAEQEEVRRNVSARLEQKYNDKFVAGVSPFDSQLGSARIQLSRQEAEILKLLKEPSLEETQSGFTIPANKLQLALEASEAQLASWSNKVKEASGIVDTIRSRIDAWTKADSKRTTTELNSATEALAAYRAKLDFETSAAGMSQQNADIERIATELVNKSKKAGIDLSIEQARIEADRHIKTRQLAVDKQHWTELQTVLDERLKAASETTEETEIRIRTAELLNAARAAGVEITEEEIRATLVNIQTMEEEQQARENARQELEESQETYNEWLEARERELELAGLTRKEREIEELALERVNLARQAGIELAFEDARAWAKNHLERIKQLKRQSGYATSFLEVWEKASEDIHETWTNMWEDLWNGNVDSAEDFADDLLDILERTAKQAAAMLVLRPVFDATGIGTLLGIPGRTGSSGRLLGSFGGILSAAAITGQGGIPGVPNPGVPNPGGAGGSGIGIVQGGLLGAAIFGLISLFKKTPRLKSWFASDGRGNLAITRSETRGIDDQATQAISTQVNSILDRLGAELSGPVSFSVLYKPDKNFLDVNFAGKTPRVFGKDDIEEAITYTVAELLKSNAVTGIAPGLQDAIRRSGEITDAEQLDTLINQYTAAQDIGRIIRDELARRDNPAQFEIDQLEAAQAARRQEIENYLELGYITQEVVDQLGRLEQIELDELLERLGDSAESAGGALDQAAAAARQRISEWLTNLNIANDNTPLSVFERRRNALSAYEETLTLARGGDVDALDRITALADQLLSLDRAATSSAADRTLLYNRIVDDLGGLSQPPPIDPVEVLVDQVSDGLDDVTAGIGTLDKNIDDGLDRLRDDTGTDLDRVSDLLGILDRNILDEFDLLRTGNTGGFREINSIFSAYPTQITTSNDNVIKALNDNISSLQSEISLLRTDTVGVGTTVTNVGASQLLQLEEIVSATEQQLRLLERGGGQSPPPGQDPPPQ